MGFRIHVPEDPKNLSIRTDQNGLTLEKTDDWHLINPEFRPDRAILVD
ncbi:MAG: hypothetical protein AAB425_04360 [Bdellovibrionota bacterium]